MEKKLNGIYVSLNIPCHKLSNELKAKGIDLSKMHIVNCIGGVKKKCTNCNCSFPRYNGSLTELSVIITKQINTGKFDFIVLDSVTTLLVYNKTETVERFIQYFVNKVRLLDMEGVILSVEGEEKSKKIIGVLSQFCDKTIRE